MLHGTMSLKPIKSLLPKVYDARFSYQEISRFSRSIRTFTQRLRPCQHHFLKTSGNEVRSLDQCQSMKTKNAVEKNLDEKISAKETIVEEYKDLSMFFGFNKKTT